MKHIIFIGILCASLLGGPVASVATDAGATGSEKYQQMLTMSPELKEADKAIKDTLGEAKSVLNAADIKVIETIHNAWVKQEFAQNVKAYMAEKMSEAEAWAMEIGSHADTLSHAVEVLRLRREGKGEEGVYEFQRGAGAQRMHGMMLIKKVDDSYTVNIEVTAGKAGAINVSDSAVCIFSGEGTFGGKILTAVMEDSPEATLSITFDGNKATVKASPAANDQCGKGMTLDATYSK